MRVFLFVLLSVAATACATRVSNTPHGFWHTNLLDQRGKPIGRWNIYYDSAQAKLLTQGCYRHGQPVGCWRYYSPAGDLGGKSAIAATVSATSLTTIPIPMAR